MKTQMEMNVFVEMNTHNPFGNEQATGNENACGNERGNERRHTKMNVEMNQEEMQRRLFNLKQMRNTYYSYRCYPRPKCSPFDKEIRELEKKLQGD